MVPDFLGALHQPLEGHAGPPEASVKLRLAPPSLPKVWAGAERFVISGFGGTVLGSKVWAFPCRRHCKPHTLLCRLQTQRLGGTDVSSIHWATWPSKLRARLLSIGSSAHFLVPAVFMAGARCALCLSELQPRWRQKWPLAPGSVRQAGAEV